MFMLEINYDAKGGIGVLMITFHKTIFGPKSCKCRNLGSDNYRIG